ncbi:MAG: DNA translocase FtsK 4TM domain-containing protein, partial [Gammaproteobacteria bacterium]|nr:DNA translocase FtsK 4TM domain-containing protein [Gammaproteobacteria bacterium]
MAQATRKANSRSPLAIHLVQGLKEALLWVLLAIAVLLFVCLLTYSPQDPSPFFSGEGGR